MCETFRKRMSELQKTARPVGTGWWEDIRREIRDRGADGETNWWEWPGIIKGGLRSGGYEQKRLPLLKRQPDWQSRWLPALKDSLPPCHGATCPEISSIAANHAFHLLNWEKATGRRITEFGFLYEIGGGYGDFARLVVRLGFQGKIIIHDLPELAAIQTMYLKEHGVKVEHSDTPAVVPPLGVRSLAVSMHAAEECGSDIADEFDKACSQFDSFLLVTGCHPSRFARSVNRPGVVMDSMDIPGHFYAFL